MSTRAMIGIHNSDDTITYIYNHYDGYPTEVGLTLYQHYKTKSGCGNSSRSATRDAWNRFPMT